MQWLKRKGEKVVMGKKQKKESYVVDKSGGLEVM